MTIRPATFNEVGYFFRHVIDHVLNGHWPMLFDTDRLRQCDELFAGEIDGKLVGVVAMASAGCDSSKLPTLATLYVVPNAQGKGIGIQLCEFALRRFIAAGKIPIYCDVTSRKMQSVIDRLPDDLKAHLEAESTFEAYGDEWE